MRGQICLFHLPAGGLSSCGRSPIRAGPFPPQCFRTASKKRLWRLRRSQGSGGREMLFNSYEFLLAFLPTVFAVHTLLRSQGLDRSAIAFLTIASFAFYGWWNPVYLLLIGALILANYALVQAIIRLSAAPRGLKRAVLVLAIVANLCVLGYFKYVNFFIDNLNALFGLDLFVAQVVLPLGISFFTFQKIALLADAYEGKIRDLNFLDYALFVLFFPQLIAGPIVHHSEAMPQFQARGRVPMSLKFLHIPAFAVGRSKKVLIPDTEQNLFSYSHFEKNKTKSNQTHS